MISSKMYECGKSEQNLASYYYLLVVELVVELVVKREFLLLRVINKKAADTSSTALVLRTLFQNIIHSIIQLQNLCIL